MRPYYKNNPTLSKIHLTKQKACIKITFIETEVMLIQAFSFLNIKNFEENIMNLSEKIQQEKKAHFIKEFKARYPEVYSWFNSSEFSSLFNNLEQVYLQIHYNRYGTRETTPALPFTDSNGVVPLRDIDEYLQIEGFDVGIKEGEGMCWLLTIKLKGE